MMNEQREEIRDCLYWFASEHAKQGRVEKARTCIVLADRAMTDRHPGDLKAMAPGLS
jgi:hypothetical protein